MSKRYTKAEILDYMLDYFIRYGSHLNGPQTSDNYVSGIDLRGKRNEPVLMLSLSNGQHFEMRAKTVQS